VAFACTEGSGTSISDSNNGLTGTISNGSWGTWRETDVIMFNGSNTHIIVPASAPIIGLTAFTYSAWIHPLAISSSPRIFSQESVSNPDACILCIAANGYIGACVQDESTEYVSNGNIPSGNFLNRWSYVAVTYDDAGDRKLHIYVNGKEIGYATQEAVSGKLRISSDDLWIGGLYSNNRSFQGKMTKINIYNRALTAGEIATAYQNEWPVSERLYYGNGIIFVH
jgi:hypothetical protein